jgi:uncharacterized protein (TIGR01777 family)
MQLRKVVIAGGSGFLGSSLGQYLADRGCRPVILSRHEPYVVWDGKTVGPWAEQLEGADAVVNFAGRSVACIHTEENKREILESRVNSVRAIEQALAACKRPPPLWIQASSLALYGNAGERICDEDAPPADDYSAGVVKAWEGAFFNGSTRSTRRVALRIGFVLGREGGALVPLVKLARSFLGGAAAGGKQYISWIHVADFCAICEWAMKNRKASGAYNVCAPAPVTNAEFMRALRRAVRRPWSPPVPRLVVKFGARFIMRADADLILTGRRCVPRRLQDEGFAFFYQELKHALQSLL